MKETEVLRLSRRWNLEKWKRCICILICPQSGIVFGVAAKLPGVCSSSLFIGAPWETGLKFKSACYHSVWRWGFLSFFPLCLKLSFPLSLIFYKSVFHYFPSFFIILFDFFIISPYFFAIHIFSCLFFPLFHHFHQLLPLTTPTLPFFIARRVDPQISLAMPCAMLLGSVGLQQSWTHDPALPSSSQPSVIPSPFPPSTHPPLCPPFWYLPSSLHPFFPL